MQNTAEILKFPEPLTRVLDMPRTREIDLSVDVLGNGRAMAVAKFRDMADKLERGELDGASCEWRRGDALEDSAGNSVIRSTMRSVTVTADTDWKVGTVKFLETKIVEG